MLCKPEDSMDWYNKMWSYTVEFFRSLDIPVRTLECCSGDLADLKVKSCDVEAWSPRQKNILRLAPALPWETLRRDVWESVPRAKTGHIMCIP